MIVVVVIIYLCNQSLLIMIYDRLHYIYLYYIFNYYVGKYFDNSAPSELLLSPSARDNDLARELWKESERLTGIKYNL